jgi:hypothetical protein
LGRQDKAFSLKDLSNINRNMGAGWTQSQMEASVNDPTAETFLNLSGFQVSRAIDASDFEGADIVHDLNFPIPEHLQDITSFFYDGGTLEHVFNVATSFKNAFDLLRVGGIALFAPPANNQCGHGFYQFSPELFFRVLGTNGFDSIHVYLVTTSRPTKWMKCVDLRALEGGISSTAVNLCSLSPLRGRQNACGLWLFRSRATTQRARGMKPRKAERAEDGHMRGQYHPQSHIGRRFLFPSWPEPCLESALEEGFPGCGGARWSNLQALRRMSCSAFSQTTRSAKRFDWLNPPMRVGTSKPERPQLMVRPPGCYGNP